MARLEPCSRTIAPAPLVSTTSYAYDPNGDLLQPITTDAQGHQNNITYTYDKLGRLSSISDGTHRYTYDANGNPVSMQVLNQGTAVYEADFSYDGGNRQTQLTDRVGTGLTTLDAYTTTYDQQGNPTQIVTNGTQATYVYNAAGELLTVEDQTGTAVASYTYDANHNRTSETTSTGTTTYAYDSADTELVSATDPSGKITSYTYDANGNLTSAVYDPSGAHQTTSYTYDANQRLAQVTLPSGETVAYTYDSAGNRLSKTVTTGGTSTEVKDVYQGGRVAYQTDGANNLLATFAYDDSGRADERAGGQRSDDGAAVLLRVQYPW